MLVFSQSLPTNFPMVIPSHREPTWFTLVRLLRWDKPAGRLILMIPALWAIFLAAEGHPPLILVGVIVVGTLVTSAAGCVINDLWDRDIDPQVERTRQRPLAARALSVKVGIAIALIALLCAAGLALYLTPLSFWLCVAAVPIIVGYPLAKRFFPIPQLVLSLAWGFAVLISWSAVTASLNESAWVLWAATVFWTLGFDTVYAMSDRDDDRKIGINSSALFFGKFAPEAVGIFYACTIGSLLYLGVILQLNIFYWMTWAIAVIGWVIQYVRLTPPDLPREAYSQLFGQNVGLGFILLAGMVMGFL